jgi:uncharacterized repeat protein (TIGR01451 family)
VTSGGTWLNVSPSAGSDLPTWQDAGYGGSETNLMLTANAAGLSPGHYECGLVITADNLISGSTTNPVYLDVQQPVVPPTARLIGLEVNQVVQDWSNSVPLIAGKVTTVRAHLQSLGNLPARVAGQLHGFRNGSEMLPPLDPKNPGGFIMARTNAPDLRHLLNNSLNFDLPTAWTTTGTVTLQFQSTNNVTCAEASGPNACSARVTFLPAVTPKVKIIAISWQEPPDDWLGLDDLITHTNSPEVIKDLVPRLTSCYPITNVDCTFSEEWWWGAVPPALTNVLPHLRRMHAADALTDPSVSNRIYYGAVAGNKIDGLAFLPGTEGSGYLPEGRFAEGRHTHSHEIGHNLSRDHATYCGAAQTLATTPPFPYVAVFAGQTKPTLGPMFDGPNALVYGYDHDAKAVVSPYAYFDMMSYCSKAPLDFWPSKYTYETLIPAISNRFPNVLPPGPLAPGNFQLFPGLIDPATDAVTFDPFVTLGANWPPPAPLPGPYALRLFNGAAQLLQQISFTPDLMAPRGDEPEMLSFLIAVPANPAIRQVQVLHGSQTIGTRTASVNSPTVHLLSPTAGDNFTGDSITIRWTGSDADGDPLTYMLQYSPDGGTTWATLTADLTSTNYVVARRLLHGTSTGRLRVTASDGFNSVMDTSGLFTAANNAPSLYLHSPDAGTLFFGNQQVVLEALAYDPEDGVLDGTNVVWNSDLDGMLGIGSRLLKSAAELSEGTHLITATAQDSAGLTAFAQVDVSVQRTVPPSLADLSVSQTSQATAAGLTFTITVENLGPSDATGLKVTDSLASGTTVVTAASTLGACTVTNGLLTCAINQLPLGESAVVTVQLAVATTGIYTNVADVRGVELDPVPSNNLAQEVAQFTAPLPVLRIELAGNSVTISWLATTSTNFVLQSSTSLFPASWSDVSDAPTNVNGRFQVTQSIANQSRYYRLLSR